MVALLKILGGQNKRAEQEVIRALTFGNQQEEFVTNTALPVLPLLLMCHFATDGAAGKTQLLLF